MKKYLPIVLVSLAVHIILSSWWLIIPACWLIMGLLVINLNKIIDKDDEINWNDEWTIFILAFPPLALIITIVHDFEKIIELMPFKFQSPISRK